MKIVLLYAWGVFLAVVNGVATFLGIIMFFDYIDTRIADVVTALTPVPNMHLLLGKSFPSDTSAIQLEIVSFAVAVWTFERWRQRQ